MSPAPCAGCGGATAPRFAHVIDPQTGDGFSIDQCNDCGLGHTRPIPDDLSRHYGRTYHGNRHSLTARYCSARRIRLLETVAVGAGRRLLDVGCGDGSFLLRARGRGWSVAGTELNPALARDRGLVVETDIASAARRGPFDACSLWHSLEHLRDPKAALRSLADLLVPGGVLLVAVPNAGGAQARLFGPRWFHLDVPRHLFHFSERSLRRMLLAAGLVPERTWHQEWEYDVMGIIQSTLNTVLPTPNAFFERLTGKPTRASTSEILTSVVLGAAVGSVAVPCTAAATLAGRGGTLVVAARKLPDRSA